MLVTPAQAAELRCCISRANGAHCIGPGCLAWRWAAVPGQTVRTHGFCGHACPVDVFAGPDGQPVHVAPDHPPRQLRELQPRPAPAPAPAPDPEDF